MGHAKVVDKSDIGISREPVTVILAELLVTPLILATARLLFEDDTDTTMY